MSSSEYARSKHEKHPNECDVIHNNYECVRSHHSSISSVAKNVTANPEATRGTRTVCSCTWREAENRRCKDTMDIRLSLTGSSPHTSLEPNLNRAGAVNLIYYNEPRCQQSAGSRLNVLTKTFYYIPKTQIRTVTHLTHAYGHLYCTTDRAASLHLLSSLSNALQSCDMHEHCFPPPRLSPELSGPTEYGA